MEPELVGSLPLILIERALGLMLTTSKKQKQVYETNELGYGKLHAGFKHSFYFIFHSTNRQLILPTQVLTLLLGSYIMIISCFI